MTSSKLQLCKLGAICPKVQYDIKTSVLSPHTKFQVICANSSGVIGFRSCQIFYCVNGKTVPVANQHGCRQ